MGQGIGEMVGYFGNRRLQSQAAEDQKKFFDYQMEAMFPFSQQATDFAQQLYGDGGFSEIGDYLENPTKPTNLQRQLFEFFGGEAPGKGSQSRLFKKYGADSSGPMAGMGVGMMEDLTGLLESLVPYGEEWAETGFKTDIQPIQDYAMRMFEREMMPEVAERFGGNIAGSGFNSEMGRTMGDVSSELGAMEVMLQEAASGRRTQGLSGPIQGIFEGPMMANAQFATAGAQAGQMYQNDIDNARPGKGLLAQLGLFAGIDQGQNFIQGGFPTSGTDYGNMASALGQGVGSAAGGLADLLKNWGGDSNAPAMNSRILYPGYDPNYNPVMPSQGINWGSLMGGGTETASATMPASIFDASGYA